MTIKGDMGYDNERSFRDQNELGRKRITHFSASNENKNGPESNIYILCSWVIRNVQQILFIQNISKQSFRCLLLMSHTHSYHPYSREKFSQNIRYHMHQMYHFHTPFQHSPSRHRHYGITQEGFQCATGFSNFFHRQTKYFFPVKVKQ